MAIRIPYGLPAISFGVIYDIVNRSNCIKYGPTFNECVLIRMS